ncbi:MAG: NAD(P)H-hydrate dehydratase [Clostridia bacterium]|nr:NAD(P)H-hydrate dehydratase [Clostridia bacterium]
MSRYAVAAWEMRLIERKAFDQGVPPLLVMENAARETANAALRMLSEKENKRALFLCGPGNNGGDGLAAARLFQQAGGKAAVYLPAEPQTPNAIENFAYARYLGIPILHTLPSPVLFDLIVDALLGIGFTRAPEDEILSAIDWANTAHLPILSVDMPSGMDANSGAVPGVCIHATETITFHAVKLGLYLTANLPYTGKVTVADIGLQHEPIGIPYYTREDLPALLPPRSINAHKGSCGRVLIYAGSKGKAGAAAMCALGALKAGAGLVTIACPDEIMPVLQTLVPNAMCVSVEEAENISFDVLAAGCGIGQSEKARNQLNLLIEKARMCVLDADALNLLAQGAFPLPENTVLTPHPLECARLLKCSLDEILKNPLQSAKRLSQEYRCIALLKNAVSVIAQGNKTALNALPAPALAKGGSGDALCGILAATLCEIVDPFESSRIAALRMSLAAQDAASQLGDRGVLTGEMLQYLK